MVPPNQPALQSGQSPLYSLTALSLSLSLLLQRERERVMSDSTTKTKRYEGRDTNEAMESLLLKISLLKKQIEASRVASIKEKHRHNVKNIDLWTSQLCELSQSIKTVHSVDQNGSRNMLSFRIENPLCKHSGYAHGSVEKDSINNQEVPPPPIVKLPYVEKIPPYTTWVYLDKNRRMPDDQSVVGRRQIYYDQSGGEALVSSDSEEEIAEPEEAKHEFSEGEDQMLRMALQEHGVSQEVLDVLSQYIRASSSEIKERYIILCEKMPKDSHGNLYEEGIDMDKDLDSALESVHSLFCRRCLVFDCRLHGYNQPIITPSEKQPHFNELGENGKPCGDQCYLWSRKQVEDICGSKSIPSVSCSDKRINGNSLETTSVPKVYAGAPNESTPTVPPSESSVMPKEKVLKHKDEVEGALSGCEWRPIERDLYLKGIEIFGKSSCLIARNLLSGLKTCMDVYTYMFKGGNSTIQSFPNSRLEDSGGDDNNHTELEIPSRSRLFRKRGRARKLKYTWKSSGHPLIRKRIADGKHRLQKQYTPCECQSTCGKQCSCVDNGTCCEKYCGCTKSCKNRFRGCHCAKSQCRSRQCPCFAANRECDPDVCRNCWVGCGDGSLGEPPARGDGYQCGNMNLLLKQRQKILLAKSNVAGWGAFIKNPVNKNDYLGEYTGEIIGHKEADKRGKIYDRANSSFLFDLDEECVLDAYRKGDKLKFANHSSTPNCFARCWLIQVMMVAGDHRVGIFAKERIEPGEELFYDYFYGPDQAPPWARKPEWSKREDSSAPHSRARKHQPH
ncbi:hypothetical protein AQUCO_00300541v1 [Aquilegia coerulea]|uniref:[histone H3]-lysine(27) N-trimethyltransferase n=1 Tax=Aquilegia coerulea TaxID=218851 RepID=A0A2G5EZE2_AQUCA|nr:hypothetical protein AQUCO_00300541v1 [Aquilegia coerulea]